MHGIHYITFGVKSLEYALNILSSTIWKIFQNIFGLHAYSRDLHQKLCNISQAYSRKFSRLWNFEYPMHIPEILHKKLCDVSQAYSGNLPNCEI